MKKYFLTLDLEEWYHLEYVKEYKDQITSDQRFVPKVIPFLRLMANEGVYMTVFALANVAKENPEVIKEIANMGHEVACHGLDHDLVYKLSVNEFREKTVKAKRILEKLTGAPVLGYRAPCFSMENEKLEILWENGFAYDASLIRFKEHNLYNVMDMSAFEKVESMIYKNGKNYELETPTFELLGKSIPISGGGYFRLFPLSFMKYLMKKHWQKEDNFVFYIHPFEVTAEQLKNARKMGIKNYFRFQIGRPSSEKKLLKYIKWLKENDVVFMRCKDYFEENKKSI